MAHKSEIKRVHKPRIKKHPSALTEPKNEQDNGDRVDIPGRVKNFQQGAGNG
jgi:hypothetical protein